MKPDLSPIGILLLVIASFGLTWPILYATALITIAILRHVAMGTPL